MAGWKKHFRPTNSVLPGQTHQSSGSTGTASVSKFNTWLPEVYQGPPNRFQRYIQYEQMDLDHEVSAALDTLAEFCTQVDEKSGTTFKLHYTDTPTETEVKILDGLLHQWNSLNNFNKRMFRLFRSTLMYGDQFMIRDPETFKLIWIDPSTVERVVVNESKGKEAEIYYVKDLDLNLQSLTGTHNRTKTQLGRNANAAVFPQAPFTGQANYSSMGTGQASWGGGGMGGSSHTGQNTSFPVDAAHMVHVSLTEGMDNSWPFGTSILEQIFKIYKQKELLEDSILIYRIHRAPERRVFFIDVGNMPPNKAQQYLERVRYEVQQKRIPSKTGGGQNIIDSAYNPMSALEDYFFAQTADGRGSKLEVLPGGENLGQIDDLRYFNNKMMRALGIPSSYLPTGPEDGTGTFNDGRVGSAFIQEFRFYRKCKRLQNQIIDTFDKEFKMFVKHRGIDIDSSIYELVFTEPKNFSSYRQTELDAQRVNVFSQVAELPYMSKRFAMKRYLEMDEDEIIENERMWREENGYQPSDEGEPGLRSVGVSAGSAAGIDPEIGDEDFGDDDVGDEPDLGGDEGMDEPGEV